MTGEIVLVADDDETAREILIAFLSDAGYAVHAFATVDALLGSPILDQASCVVTDVRMPGTDGAELVSELTRGNRHVPAVVIMGHGEIAGAVRALRAGAFDYMEKSIKKQSLLESVSTAIAAGIKVRAYNGAVQYARQGYERLPAHEREILALLVAGNSNKVIAHELDISPRTVETHRASLMSRWVLAVPRTSCAWPCYSM